MIFVPIVLIDSRTCIYNDDAISDDRMHIRVNSLVEDVIVHKKKNSRIFTLHKK